MKRLLLLLVAGLLLLLIPGEVLAASNCVIHSPANTTFTNASAPRFEIRCFPEIINYSTAAGIGKIPQANISFSNGSAIASTLNLTLNLTMGGNDNISAFNVSGSYTAIPDGNINLTYYYYNTTSTVLTRLQRYFTVDTKAPDPITVLAPTNRTYSSGAVNLTCSSTNSSTFTYTVDGGTNVTLSATAVTYKEATTSTLADGAHSVTCTATKDANSLSNTSAAMYFTVNASSPTVRVIHPLSFGDNIFPIDDAVRNVSWSINITIGGPSDLMALNLSNISINLPTLFTDSPATGAALVNFSGYTNFTRTAARHYVLNTTNVSASIVNGTTQFAVGLLFNSSVVAAEEGDGTLTVDYNVSTLGGGYVLAQDTVTLKVRNVSKGPFLVNNTCGMSVTETRTANKTTFLMANSSPCNFTYWAPYLTPGNTSLTNTTLYGWKCTYPCIATNASANSSRFGMITMEVPANSTTVTIEKAAIFSTAGWPGGVAGVGAGAGLAVVAYGAYRVHRGRRRSKEGE